MQLLLHSWDRFFYRKVPPHALAIVRIALGLFLMLYFATQWVQAPLFSMEQGLTVPFVRGSHPLFFFLFHPSLSFLHVVFASIFCALFSFTLGFRTRTSALVLLGFLLYFHLLTQYLFSASFYRLFGFGLMSFLLPGGGKTFSIDMMQKEGSFFAWEPISILPQRFLALQVTVTYFAVGWQKLFLPVWNTGAVLRNGFMGRWATPLAWYLVRRLPESAFDSMITSVKIFECLIPFGLWIPRLRGWFFVGGFLFHTIITLTLEIWWFQFLVPLYIVFLDPEEVYRYCRKVSGGRIR